jgi:cytidine deaminase
MYYERLIKAALKVKKNAYAPYSRFYVGAALASNDGKIYVGCNVENSSYGMTMCAERVAFFKAISDGARGFKAIAVVSDDPGHTMPCGACRQVMSELAGEDLNIVTADQSGLIQSVKLKELLPRPFFTEKLKRM